MLGNLKELSVNLNPHSCQISIEEDFSQIPCLFVGRVVTGCVPYVVHLKKWTLLICQEQILELKTRRKKGHQFWVFYLEMYLSKVYFA